jgi:hypothetical protein
MNKLNRILIVILVLQLALAAVVFWPRQATTEEVQSLFPNLETSRVVRVTITGADGERIVLAKEGADWVLPEADNYPVLSTEVSATIDKIVGLQTGQMVTETSGSHERLGVADDSFERKVELELDGGTRYTLYVGTSPSVGATHIRAGGEDEVYLTTELLASDVGVLPTDWADRTYFSVPEDQVMRLSLENQNGEFTFIRLVSGGELAPTQEVWSMADLAQDETLNTSAVQALFSRATSVAMQRPLGTEEKPEYGMESPSAVVTLRTQSEEDGTKNYTLRVGAKNPEDGSYVVISSESPYYVQVSELAVQSFVENARPDFLELPPTPEATPEATPEG